MSDAMRKLAVVSGIAVLAGWLFFLAVSAFSFPVRTVLLRFQWQWILRNAGARLIETLPALLIGSIFVTFSLLVHSAGGDGTPSFFSRVNGPIVFLLVITVGYAFLVLVVQPRLIAARDELSARTAMARGFRTQAEEHIAEGELSLAITELRHYLAINPEDTEAVALLADEVSNLARREEQRSEEPITIERRVTDRQNLDAVESTELAQRYFEAENYITALYYARLALDLDPDREDAQRWFGLASEQLSAGLPSSAEEEERWLFLRKREGYRAYEQGLYLEAYYLFRDLADRYPGDPDVRVYLQDTRAALLNQAFFLEEILPIVALSGGAETTIVNPDTEEGREFLHLDKVIEAVNGTFALGIEALALSDSGEVLYHLSAPYGKIRDGTINLHAVSERNASESITPRYYVGTRPPELRHVLTMEIPPSDLMMLSKANAPLSTARLWELLRMTEDLERYGYGEERPQTELLRRILEPFSLIVAALFAIGLAWQLRSRYGARPPIVALLLVPAFPFVVYYGFVCFRFAVQILSTHLILHIGMTGALAASVGVHALLLAIGLLYVATRMTE